MTSCRTCGNPLSLANRSECAKCGDRNYRYQPLLVVDVAHSGGRWEEANQKIVKAVDQGLSESHKGVKIIHGHGRSTGRSIIRKKAIDLLRELECQTRGRVTQDNGNPGAHILWFNR